MLPLLAVVLPSLLLSLPSSGSPQLLAPPLPQPQKKPSTLDNPKQCEPVAIPMCQNMRYNATAMPNHFGHLTQKEAGAQIEHFAALVMVGCSAELQFFLCSMYAPICMSNFPESIPVCRPVCQRVYRDCFPVMKEWFPWPEKMRCDLFPERPTNKRLCMDPTNVLEKKKKPGARSRVEDVASHPSPIHPFVLTGGRHLDGGDMVGVATDKEGSSSGCPGVRLSPPSPFHGTGIAFRGVPDCAPPCRLYADQSEESSLEVAVMFLFPVCLLVSSFSVAVHVLSAVADKEARTFPEWAEVYYSGCYFVVASVFLVRICLGHTATSCTPAYPPSSPSSSSSSLMSIRQSDLLPLGSPSVLGCLATAALLQFALSAAADWFLVVAAAWFMSTTLRWTAEALDRLSCWFHLVAWLLPLLETSSALIFLQLEGDPRSGFCFLSPEEGGLAWAFVAPTAVKAAAGFALMAAGMWSALQICKELPKSHTKTLRSLMTHLGFFSASFLLPTLTSVAIACASTRSPSSWAVITKYSTLLLPGILGGLHSISRLPEAHLASSRILADLLGFYRRAKDKSALPVDPRGGDQQGGRRPEQPGGVSSSENLHLANRNLARAAGDAAAAVRGVGVGAELQEVDSGVSSQFI